MSQSRHKKQRNIDVMNGEETVSATTSDLYDWRQVSNELSRLKSQMSSNSSSNLAKKHSLAAHSPIAKVASTGKLSLQAPPSRFDSQASVTSSRLRPLSSTSISKLNKQNDFSDIDLIDLDRMDDAGGGCGGGGDLDASWRKKRSIIDAKNNTNNNNNRDGERAYLNSARGESSMQSRKTLEEMQQFINAKINKKETVSVLELDMSQYGISKIQDLTKLKNLRILDLSCNRIECIENLSFRYLNELRLFANDIQILSNLESLPELQSLQLQSNKICSPLGRSLMSLKKLEYLRLDHNRLARIEPLELASCGQLIYLNISHNEAIDSLRFISYLPNLEELDASHLSLASLDGVEATKFRMMSGIDLSYNKFGDEIQALAPLQHFRNLTTLKLAHNSLTSLDFIVDSKSIRNLDVANNKIASMRCLTTLSETLETLDISNNLISEWMDVEALVLCSQLSELYLSDNPVSEAKTHEDFTKALPNLKYIDDKNIEEIKDSQVFMTASATSDVTTHTTPINNKSAPTSAVQKKTESRLSDHLKLVDPREIATFQHNFINKFNEISECLKNMCAEIEPKSSVSSQSAPTPSLKSSDATNNEPAQSVTKKTSKHRLIHALHFSKQLTDLET